MEGVLRRLWEPELTEFLVKQPGTQQAERGAVSSGSLALRGGWVGGGSLRVQLI